MMTLFLDPYTIHCSHGAIPALDEYTSTQRVDRFFEVSGAPCFIAVARGIWEHPFLVVAQTYWPSGFGWNPGILLIPETHLLLIGAGERLLAYDLRTAERLWIDTADTGFYRWDRHGEMVLMSAELELAAWTMTGVKRWSVFVEPPWSYTVTDDGTLIVDVMGQIMTGTVWDGPQVPQ